MSPPHLRGTQLQSALSHWGFAACSCRLAAGLSFRGRVRSRCALGPCILLWDSSWRNGHYLGNQFSWWKSETPGGPVFLRPRLRSERASEVAHWQRICLPMWVRPLGQEDPLEEAMAIHFSILAWRIPWTEETSRLQSMGSKRVRHDWAQHSISELRHHFFSPHFIAQAGHTAKPHWGEKYTPMQVNGWIGKSSTCSTKM